MLVNFGVVNDFKSTEKYAVLKNTIARGKASFSSDIRKLQSYAIYSSDITYVSGRKLEAIWTKFKINGEESLVLLDVVKGKYENSKYLNQQLILEQFFQGGKRITQKITAAHFENSVYKLGHEIEEPLYFFHRKVVKLSCHQEDILHKELHPGFYILSGIAGSGKTSLAYLKLKELYKTGGNCLFTTGNRNLAEYLEGMFREEEGAGNVEFLGYKDLVNSYYRGIGSLEKVSFAEFSNYAQGKSAKTGIDHKMLYSLMQYIASKPDVVPGKRDFFKQISVEQFKYCVKLYGGYMDYLYIEGKIDLSLSVLEPRGEISFDYIIVDEAQDLSPREIENIGLLRNTDTGVIVFNVDSNQHSNISLPVKYLKSHEYTREIIDILDSSFRIPRDISKYAQAIVDVRSFVMQGVPDKDMIKEFSSSNENKGNVVHINVEDAKRLIDTVSIAIIAFDDREKEEVEQLLSHITQIFTADEVKGLEYETIIVYNPYNKFSEILARNHGISWDESEVKTNLPKDINTIDHDVKILFNQFFTSITRSKNNLYILEKNPEWISNYCLKFKRYLTRNIEEGMVCQDDKITDEEWIYQINVLAVNGNISQAVKAYKKREFSIDKIKKENLAILTYEICLVAVLSNIRDLENIPKMQVDYRLYRDIISYKNFREIPTDLKSICFCRIAVDIDVDNILYVPSEHLKILYRYLLERFDYSLSKVPQHLLTPDLCLIAMEEDFENNFNHIPHKFMHDVYRAVLQEKFFGSLKNFPPELINLTLAAIAVGLDARNLEYLPDKFLKEGVYRSALKPYNDSLECFPMTLIDQGLAEVAAKLDVCNLRYLSYDFLTENVYRSTLMSYNNSLENFPQEFINPSLAKIAVELDPYNLKYYPYNGSLKIFPKEFITQSIAEVAAALNPYNLSDIYAARKKFNLGKIYKSSLESYGCSLEKFPQKFINQHLVEVAIKLNISNLEYLSDNQKTYKIYKLVIEACDNSLKLFLENFPNELKQRVAEVAVNLDVHNLKQLPDKFKNYDTYRSALNSYSNSLEKFPQEFINPSLAKIAVKLDPHNLQYYPYNGSLKNFPKELISQDIAIVAAELNAYNLEYISSDFKVYSLYRAVLKTYKDSLKNFPIELIDHGLAEVAAKLDVCNLRYLPHDFLTENIYRSTLRSYNNSLKNFHQEFINPSLAKIAVELDPYNLQYYPYNGSLKNFPKELISQNIVVVAAELAIEEDKLENLRTALELKNNDGSYLIDIDRPYGKYRQNLIEAAEFFKTPKCLEYLKQLKIKRTAELIGTQSSNVTELRPGLYFSSRSTEHTEMSLNKPAADEQDVTTLESSPQYVP